MPSAFLYIPVIQLLRAIEGNLARIAHTQGEGVSTKGIKDNTADFSTCKWTMCQQHCDLLGGSCNFCKLCSTLDHKGI